MSGPKSRKKKFIVRLELGARGLLATGVVCFCALLWMFLLGIWAGDHLLTSGTVDGELAPVARPLSVPAGHAEIGVKEDAGFLADPIVLPPVSEPQQPKRLEKKNISPRAAKISRRRKKKPRLTTVSPRATSGGSFFTLQVGAYRENSYAIEEVARLKARDLDAFMRRPEPGRGKFIRVYIGRYSTMAAARDAAAAIGRERGLKSFVVMIPGSGGRK